MNYVGPGMAIILVIGIFISMTGIQPGPHTVEVARPGYADWAGNVTVKPGLKSFVYADQ